METGGEARLEEGESRATVYSAEGDGNAFIIDRLNSSRIVVKE